MSLVYLLLEWFYDFYGCFFSTEELFQGLLFQGNFQLHNFFSLLCSIFPPNKGCRREGNSEKFSHSIDCFMRTCMCDDKCFCSDSWWYGDIGDNEEDIRWHWHLKLQLCVCTCLQGKRGETAKKYSETSVEGFKLSLNLIRREISLSWCSSS